MCESWTERINLSIRGMTCKRCASRIRIALSNIPGVFDVHVSYKDCMATVTFDPTLISVDDILSSNIFVKTIYVRTRTHNLIKHRYRAYLVTTEV